MLRLLNSQSLGGCVLPPIPHKLQLLNLPAGFNLQFKPP